MSHWDHSARPLTYDQLSELRVRANQSGKTIAWTNGCFDILHPGHLMTFARCKELADIVVVGLNSDKNPYFSTKPGRPINDENFRAQMLLALRDVDYIYSFSNETPLQEIITLQPDYLIKWGDYDLEKIVGYAEVISRGGQVLTVPTVGDYSTSRIIKKIIETYR